MTAKTKASGNIKDGNNTAMDAHANAAGIEDYADVAMDPTADVQDGESDFPEMTVDGGQESCAKALYSNAE
jgi:hypothetical protein